MLEIEDMRKHNLLAIKFEPNSHPLSLVLFLTIFLFPACEAHHGMIPSSFLLFGPTHLPLTLYPFLN